MKPLKKQLNVAKAPAPAVARNRMLGMLDRIRNASLPRDAIKFTLTELRDSGLAEKYQQPSDLPDRHFKLLVLMATQINELHKERDRLLLEKENGEDYYSPIRDELRQEPDPIKQTEISRRAEADEARVAQDRASRKQFQIDCFHQLSNALGRRPWLSRDKRRQPWAPTFWHQPMTVMAYHRATGLSRRTIQNVLRRIKAVPLENRSRRKDPARYGTKLNFTVLREWLLRYEKKPEHRRAWLVRTLLKYKYEMPEQLETLTNAVIPVLRSLEIDDPGNSPEFMAYYRQCETLLYPPPSPLLGSGISALLELSHPLPNIVGKTT